MTSESVDPGRPVDRPEKLSDIEAIKHLKYAYFRLLDQKELGQLGELLTEDATSSYESGKYSHNGRAEIVSFLEGSLGNASIVHQHLGHHPEIILTSEDEAVGHWYLHDRVVVPGADFELGGTAIYSDRYQKRDGRWLISHTGYERIYEEQRHHSTGALISFKSRFDEVGDDPRTS
jgi:hypothetical protein